MNADTARVARPPLLPEEGRPHSGRSGGRIEWRTTAAVLAAFFAFTIVLQAFAQPPSATPASLATYAGADRHERILAAAKKEGTLTLYTTFAAYNLETVATDFERRYGVKINPWRSGTLRVLQRTLNEAKAGRFEVDAILFGSPEMEALYREKLLQEVRSPLHKNLIEGGLPAHSGWAAVYLNLFAHAYNTAKVKREELPKTYADLLDPRWRGRLGVESQDQEWFLAIVKDMGEARGLKFFRDLVATNGLSVRTGHSLLTNMVASGEVPLALTVHSYMPEQMKRKGAPIEWFVLEPAVVRPNAVGVMRRAPHPNAALLFYEVHAERRPEAARRYGLCPGHPAERFAAQEPARAHGRPGRGPG